MYLWLTQPPTVSERLVLASLSVLYEFFVCRLRLYCLFLLLTIARRGWVGEDQLVIALGGE